MLFDQLQRNVEQLESEIANGPIVPTVTPQEIRDYLAWECPVDRRKVATPSSKPLIG
jgi:hypothetical protein